MQISSRKAYLKSCPALATNSNDGAPLTETGNRRYSPADQELQPQHTIKIRFTTTFNVWDERFYRLPVRAAACCAAKDAAGTSLPLAPEGAVV